MSYLNTIDAELEPMLGEMPEPARKEILAFVRQTARESFKNGLSAGMRRAKSGAYVPAAATASSE